MSRLLAIIAAAVAAATARRLTPPRDFLRGLLAIDKRGYRPEKYYMRGPGPKWHDKQARGRISSPL